MDKQNKKSISKVFFSFLKLGTIGFGGGSALIPVVEKELVQDKKALTEQDYLKHTVVANITPGALPVKLGATCGYQLHGLGGSLAGAYGMALPGVLLTVILMALFSVLGEGTISYFNYASVGITAFIVFLLISYVTRTVKAGDRKTNLALCLAAFAITGGKELREIIGLLFTVDHEALGLPLFDISTIDLILLAFFVILLLEKIKSRAELYGVFTLCGVYAFFVGKTGKSLGLNAYGSVMLLAMLAVVVLAYVLRRNGSGGKGSRLALSKTTLLLVAVFLLLPILVAIGVQMLVNLSSGHSLIEFLTQVASSTITSFGGGEAYVSVADGIFVQGGYVAPDIFYTRLVPVANSLPGPILVKIAAGMGFLFGQEAGGAAAGWIVSLTAAAMAVGVCSGLAVLVMSLYDSVKQWAFITNLKKYILPVICGMLLSTSCAMIFESMKITGEKGISGLLSLPAILLSVYGVHFLHKKFHLHDVLLLLLTAALSLGVLLIV